MAAATAAPEETLSRAVAAINAGHHQKGAKLAYQAAWDALSRQATLHGRFFNDDASALEFTQWLDANNSAQPIIYDRNGASLGRKLAITSGFIIAMGFKEHAETPLQVQQANTERYWQPHEYHRYLPPVRELTSAVKHIAPQDEI